MALDGHRTAERRSLALHRLVADRLDDAIVDRARAGLERRIVEGRPAEAATRTWLDLLGGPPDELRARLVEDSEEMRDLRQSTPFAGVLEPRERWAIIREVR